LAARFGYDDPIFKESDEELIDAAVPSGDPRLDGMRASEMPLDRAYDMSVQDGAPMIMCKTVTPKTPSGKIELFSQEMEDKWGRGVPTFERVIRDRPFAIISPSSSKRTNATFGGCGPSDGAEVVEINPADADAHGISDGMMLCISNDKGAVELKAVVTDAVRPGVLYSPKGTWCSTSATGQTVNALIPVDVRADIEEGAAYNETFVDIELI